MGQCTLICALVALPFILSLYPVELDDIWCGTDITGGCVV